VFRMEDSDSTIQVACVSLPLPLLAAPQSLDRGENRLPSVTVATVIQLPLVRTLTARR